MNTFSQQLLSRQDLWSHWGFAPWAANGMAGVFRRQHFVKDGFLGRIAEYMALDYIVWDCGTAELRRSLWHSLKPLPEIMTQRFLFIMEEERPVRQVRSFCLGFRGYAEFFTYWPEKPSAGNPAPPDLTGLVDLAVVKAPGKQA